MLRAIRDFFQQQIEAEMHDSARRVHGLHLATAALLLEVARADFHCGEEELEAVQQALQRRFELSAEETREVAELARTEVEEAVSLHQFTRLMNDHFSHEEKAMVVEMLWEVALVDGVLDKYEEALVRKLADLLYVPHSQFIQAKHRVQARLDS
jgi:uncharacterized tellurite resistance protein B-like protein